VKYILIAAHSLRPAIQAKMQIPCIIFLLSGLISIVGAIPSPRVDAASRKKPVNETACAGKRYAYNGLAGYGYLPSDARDFLGDTIGGIGSSIAIDTKSWEKTAKNTYKGIVWAMPDRGWLVQPLQCHGVELTDFRNAQGTLNYVTRVHKLGFTLTLAPDASLANPSPPNLVFEYLDTVLFYGPDGTTFCTSLDADVTGSIKFPGFPEMPVATWTGDGFGGPGEGGKGISIDAEGLVLNNDGSFWVSDEYGPYIYKFSSAGIMQAAIRPPEAFIPRRNGTVSFSSNTPPIFNPKEVVIPTNPVSGRSNNQGFEGLTVSDNGKTLYVLIQSALTQEGGPGNPGRKQARLVVYDISGRNPKHTNEYVVTLPLYTDPTSKSVKVAAQSEIHFISPTQFLILARDSGAGGAQASTTSVYRHVDVFSIAKATDIKSNVHDAANGSIASSTGVLDNGIKAAEYCSFLDFNVNSELGKFGARNGGTQDPLFLLNEKWESLALVPQDPKDKKCKDYFLFSFSDNDFITQNGKSTEFLRF
jgi:hypothetical protein